MPALYSYSYAQTLLKIENVCLNASADGLRLLEKDEPGSHPILKNVNAEIRKIIRPGQVTGQVVGFIGPSGIGKCLAPGTPVLMYDGAVKNVESIRIGDLLMGPDSKSRRVLSLARGTDEMYDVIPVKGDSYRVNKPHILSLHVIKGKRSKARIDNISVEDYLGRSRTYKSRAKSYRVGVEFPAQAIPLDPYFFGLWLGDGDSDTPAITNQDADVVNALHVYAAAAGAEISTYAYGTRCTRYRVHNDWNRDDSVLSNLRSLAVMGNKHVPLVYKANSREIRLEVLAGIIDSDGSPTNGCYDFVSKFQQLASDVCYLARSLGFAAYMKPCNKTCQTGNGGTYYRVIISGDLNVIPVRIKRKILPSRKQIKNVLRTGITVSPAGYGRYFGFELDGDGLFLLGDFTVTHNTQLFRIIAGLNRPTSGQVTINSDTKPVQAGEVGVVAQNYPLFAHHSVMGNLMLAARQAEKDEKTAHDKVMSFLAEFELDSKASLYPAQLSGGQRQRIAIIQQILCGEHFLLMDEPFSGLDIKVEEKAIQLIMKVANMDDLNTVIVVTHDVSAAATVSDHIWALGRDFDEAGNPLPGSHIKFTYDLIERGLCWDQWSPEAQIRPAMVEFIRELKSDFYKL